MREPLPGLVLLTLAVLVPVAISAQMASPLDEQLSRAQALQKKGEAQDTLRMYESLLPELKFQFSFKSIRAGPCGRSATISLSEGDYAKAIQTANSAAEVYRSLGDASDQARALNDKSIAEIEHGDYSAALGDLANALDSAGKSEMRKRKSRP